MPAAPTWEEAEIATGDDAGVDPGEAPDTATEYTEDGIGEIAALDRVPLI